MLVRKPEDNVRLRKNKNHKNVTTSITTPKMPPHKTLIILLVFCFVCHQAFAINVSDPYYTTSADITTTNDHGLNSTLDGSAGSPNSITNHHIITTGNSGTSSGDYGIKLTGQYYEIFKHSQQCGESTPQNSDLYL